ncbi:MAG: PH domain-containing protein [Planctomycetaceae bacterium]|nr:PH domain-containing protein [Planctomycetaceae bacterium]
MKCAACQTEIEASSVYCPKCGARIDGGDEEKLDGAPSSEGVQPSETPEAEPESEPAKQPTASERLLEAARSASRKEAETDISPAWTEGGYSPKALNARFYNTIAVTILLLLLPLWLTMRQEWGNWVWYPALILIVALWIWFVCVRIYRVWTIKYQLTAHQFYHEEGIFRRVRDVVEVIDIDDMKLERTLWDRMVNGGVGTVIIKSTDQSNPELRLVGLDNPEVVFKSLDDARQKERVARGLKSV